MALEKQDFQAALREYSEEAGILPDDLWWLYQAALRHAIIREQSTHLLAELMTAPVTTVSPQDLLAEVSQQMLKKQVSGFPVVENNRLVGIITEGDLMMTLGVPSRHPHTSRLQQVWDAWKRPRSYSAGHANSVRDVMTSLVVTSLPQDNLGFGMKLMRERQVTRLVIVDEQQHVVGIVTRSDILRFTSAAPQTTPPLPPVSAN